MYRYTPRDCGVWTFLTDRFPDFKMQPHCHEDHEINVCVRGAGRYVLATGQSCPLAAGQILYLPGGVAHELKVDERIVIRGLCVHPSEFKQFANGQARPLSTFRNAPLPKLAIDAGLYASFLGLYEQLRPEQTHTDTLRAQSIGHLAQLAAVQLLRLVARPEASAQPSRAEQRVINTRVWMDHNFAEEIDLDRLSELSGLSPSHFAYLFRKAIGKSPKQYVLDRRLEYAASLLAQTGMPVLEVALESGFAHLAHFNRCFKQYARLTPTAHRKKHQRIR
jgi:AraC-like DNA-binding protein